MEKLTTKKRLYELLENGYTLKLTNNTFEKMKNFVKSIENDEAFEALAGDINGTYLKVIR